MRKGKIAAQVAHASMKVILDRMVDYNGIYTLTLSNTDPLKLWINNLFTKIVVSCDSEQELLDIYQKAKEHQIISAIIQDSGLTEFNGVPTLTCCALGPDYKDILDPITGKLKLL